jgi:hypothetical protein
MGVWLQLIGRSAVDTVTTVTIPVAVLLWVLAWLEASGRFQPAKVLAGSGWRQTVYSAGIAAVPGCAGGIAVSKLYVDGVVSAAALWAAHVATAGDASFVLLVGKPLVALGIFAFLFVLGSLSGILMSTRRREEAAAAVAPLIGAAAGEEDEGTGVPRLYLTWVAVVVAAVAAAILANSLGPVLAGIAGVLAVGAVVLSIGVQRGWQMGPADPAPAVEPAAAEADPPAPDPAAHTAADPAPARGMDAVMAAVRTAVKDASEITLWVAVADLAFYAVQLIWGPQVKVWMNGAVLPVTLISVLVGMIPGCGPQIFLARLYTAGSLPFAAIVANSVSQHGDSIFPLLARRRGQAMRVTLTSTALAVVIGVVAVVVTAHGLG